MGVYTNIREAFESKLDALRISESLPPIAWENVEFDPHIGTSFITVFHIPTGKVAANRFQNPQFRYEGTFLVEVYCPKNEGPNTVDTICDTIIQNFPEADTITGSSVTLTIRNSERVNSFVDNSWYIGTMNISYYLYDNT